MIQPKPDAESTMNEAMMAASLPAEERLASAVDSEIQSKKRSMRVNTTVKTCNYSTAPTATRVSVEGSGVG